MLYNYDKKIKMVNLFLLEKMKFKKSSVFQYSKLIYQTTVTLGPCQIVAFSGILFILVLLLLGHMCIM